MRSGDVRKDTALLERGARVGVVAPGFAVRKEPLRSGVRALREMGFDTVLGPSVSRRAGYFAGTDEERAADLNAFLRDPSVRAVWFARGGYGAARILARVDWDALARDPKPLLGYSDATALFAVALRSPRKLCLYAPVVAELGTPDAYDARSLSSLLAGKPYTIRFGRRQVLRAGKVEGRILGGNLTLLVHLLGTESAARLDGSVLLLEETGEESYRLDRLLQHLRMSSAIDRVAAVIVGSFSPPPTRRAFPKDRLAREILSDFLLPLGVPVVTALPLGHLPGKRSVPLGGTARLDTRNGRLELIPRPPSLRRRGGGR
jgi:muramoyltetrapeptide carboxypeptidase